MSEDPTHGIVPFAINGIFRTVEDNKRKLRANQSLTDHHITVSYLEIYNEQCVDLL